jgi:hypothetical protein
VYVPTVVDAVNVITVPAQLVEGALILTVGTAFTVTEIVLVAGHPLLLPESV